MNENAGFTYSYRQTPTTNIMVSMDVNEDINNQDMDSDSSSEYSSETSSVTSSETSNDRISVDSSIEQIGNSRFNLVVVCIYNSKVHGCRLCDGHYLVYSTLTPTNYYRRGVLRDFKEMNAYYSQIKHRFIRNFNTIMNSPSMCSPQIAECIYLPGGEYVAIIKTMYIRIIQRAWKKAYALRVRASMNKLNPTNILYRLAHGVWPECCTNMPTIRGILAYMRVTQN